MAVWRSERSSKVQLVTDGEEYHCYGGKLIAHVYLQQGLQTIYIMWQYLEV